MGKKLCISIGSATAAVIRVMVLLMFIMILAVQNMSMLRTVHAFTGDVCSCGCEDEGATCDSSCCATQSISQCDCNEPHEDVVVFILPGTLDNFLQTDTLPENVHLRMTQFHEYDCSLYESFLQEPPSPIPIV